MHILHDRYIHHVGKPYLLPFYKPINSITGSFIYPFIIYLNTTERIYLVFEVTKRQTAAKSALELPHAKVGVPYTGFKHYISKYIHST